MSSFILGGMRRPRQVVILFQTVIFSKLPDCGFFEIDPLLDSCGAQMQIASFNTDCDVVDRIAKYNP